MISTDWGAAGRAAAGFAGALFVLVLAGCGNPQDGDGGADGAVDRAAPVSVSVGNSADSGVTFGGDAGGLNVGAGSGPCVPAAACPSAFACGRYTDPCTGAVFECGSPCKSGEVCTPDPTGTAQACASKACSGECGVVGVDSCGVAIGCGGCAAGLACVDNRCTDAGPAPSASDACAPLTCTPDPQTALCGTITDGCGHTKSCSCPAGQACSGGVCIALPPECTAADGGALCGSVANACGSGNVACGSCPTGAQCVKNACTECTPPSCGNSHCGTVSNGCGASVSCGSCATGDICYEGACCTESSCGEASDAGLVTGCAPVDLGCGVKKVCAPCQEGEVCTNDQCVACTPKTCADFGNDGCGHSDGCGNTLNCCATGTTCQGGAVCCPAGEVDYNGSCCKPACDAAQPAGTQMSCGQVIDCPGGAMPPGSGPPR